jgi:hypothetical protein
MTARVAHAWMQQDGRRAVAPAVVGPYLAAVNGDHDLTHDRDYRMPHRAMSRGFPGLGISVDDPFAETDHE